jgi:NADH-quinone oxidoreductase subunit N
MIMLPEILLIITAFSVIFLDLFLPPAQARRLLLPAAAVGLLAAGLAAAMQLPQSGQIFGGQFRIDPVANWFKLFFALAGLLTVAVSSDMLSDAAAKVGGKLVGIGSPAEYLAVILFNLCGMMFLVSSDNLVTLYVSLELATIPLFLLAAWRRGDRLSSEAGMRYVIIGAMSSGGMLYGLGLIYGLSGTTNLAQIATSLSPSPALSLALVMVLVGLGFKLTLAPFHLWAGDVYQGAPAPITGYLSVASKAAGLAFAFQLFFRIFAGIIADLGMLIAVLATLTMTIGNTAAVVQQNIKRFMAFSAISQAGYLLMGFLGPSHEGVASMLYYVLVYIVSNMAVFAVIIWYLQQTGRQQISDYRGLSRRHPLIALVMMIALFSLAGIPPLSGFVGKFFLFNVAAKAGFYWLVGVAAVNSTISLYYYLRIVRQMYIEDPDADAEPLKPSRVITCTLALSAIAIIALGILPQFYETIFSHTAGWLTTATSIPLP